MKTWNKRYASGVCVLCGLNDSGNYQDVRKGKCVDKEGCISRQEFNRDNPPVKKPRKKPIVDRKGMAACSHQDCVAENKRYPATEMSWEKSGQGRAACDKHWASIYNATDYYSWKNEFKK
jgi:hypothetical protein